MSLLSNKLHGIISPGCIHPGLNVLALAAAVMLCGTRPEVYAGDAAVEGMIEVTLPKLRIEGEPISWNHRVVHLLGRDGRLWQFAPADVIAYRQTAARFRAYSLSEFRAELLRELGADYEVSGTGHYLVANPAGQRDLWADRFEELYRSFVHFFSVRGFRIEQPQFPLVGIVCRDRSEFMRIAARETGTGPICRDQPSVGAHPPGARLKLDLSPFPDFAASGGITGSYNLDSNRIALYDMGGRGDSPDWRRNAAVLIHEATHQTAFNTGVHSRYSPPPTWVAEGLAMLFEAPGVNDPHDWPRLADRVNRDRLQAFRRYVAPRHRPEALSSMVATDDWFRADPTAAYAEAWALSFFLVETEPSKYMRYLKLTAAGRPFQKTTTAQRTADFTSVFGTDWQMLEARFLRFIEDL